MDFSLNDDQRMLVDTVSSFTRKESPVERFRTLRQDPRGWDPAVWKQMGELGWLGVMFPEAVGGAGMSFVEAALILEQLGTTLVPEPYLASVVLAGSALLQAGNAEQHARWLTPMIAGDTSLALATTEVQSRSTVTDVETRAERVGDGWRLSGQKRWVLNGHAAQHLLVSARTAGASRDAEGISLFVIDRDQPGVELTSVQCMDGHRAAMLSLSGVELGADRLLGAAGAAAPVLEAAQDLGAAGAAAEGSGLLQAVLAMTRSYLLERKQFGVAIGTFQALQHRCVDMFVEVELCKSTAILAMIKGQDPDVVERQTAISAAKVQLGAGGAFVVRQGTQLHGGIGVTDEHDVGLYFKRVHVLSTLFGDEQHHLARFASLPSFTVNV